MVHLASTCSDRPSDSQLSVARQEKDNVNLQVRLQMTDTGPELELSAEVSTRNASMTTRILTTSASQNKLYC